MPRNSAAIRPRTAVTALYAGCRVSSSFLPAEINSPSAPKVSAAWAFCCGDSDLLMPNHEMATRTAVVMALRRWAGELTAASFADPKDHQTAAVGSNSLDPLLGPSLGVPLEDKHTAFPHWDLFPIVSDVDRATLDTELVSW